MFKIPGLVGAVIEITLYASSSTFLYTQIKEIDVVTYYWLTFTVLTGFWEAFYILGHRDSINVSKYLLETKSNVWTSDFDLSMILPWKFSVIFYGEYGAYADREYMTEKDNWSRLIEGTHALFCGIFSLLTLLLNLTDNYDKSEIALSVAMGSQLMNSILYMGEYSLQTKDKDNLNYKTDEFPLGQFWNKRPFMYINIFWTLMPVYAIIQLL